MASLHFPRFESARKAYFTSKQACFTRLRLGFTYASLRLLQVFSLGSSTERREIVSSSSLACVLFYQRDMTDVLKNAGLNGREDKLGAKGEALAWALRKAWYAQGNGCYGLLKFVTENVTLPESDPG